MNKRFGLQKITYMFTDLDELNAQETWQAYSAAWDGDHRAAVAAAKRQTGRRKWLVSPYEMEMETFRPPNSEQGWNAHVRARAKIELSVKEYRAKVPKQTASRVAGRFKIWAKRGKRRVAPFPNASWLRLDGDMVSTATSGGNLLDWLSKLSEIDKHRFPDAWYAADSPGFSDFVRLVFDFWGNTEYRCFATASGAGGIGGMSTRA